MWATSTDLRNWVQAAAEIELRTDDGVQIARVEGSESVHVEWPFATLQPRQRATVRVRVYGTDGSVSDWSPPGEALAGFLGPDEWSALFIGAGVTRPQLLRSTFRAHEGLRRATLYSTAFGAYALHLNGESADDEDLKPGWTSYQWRTNLITTDVTPLICNGDNTIGVTLAGGWFTEAYGFRDAAARFYTGSPAVAVQLILDYADGTRETIVTGPGWKHIPAAVTSASLYQGETYDAREEIADWSRSEFDDAAWHPVVVEDNRGAVPIPRTTPPVRVTETIGVTQVVTTPTGKTVLDFGQNLVGVVQIRVKGTRGHTITLRHAEVLEHGELGTRPLRNAAATDRYTLRGGAEETWRPRWTFHGFRYVQVDDWPTDLDPAAFTALVIHSDMARIGDFSTSHELLQQLHNNVVWSTRGNFLSVPSDCPQRDERLGWTGDLQVFAPTASFIYDCDSFLRSWMADVVLEQRAAGGVVPMVVPSVIPQVPGLTSPIAAWGDAICAVPNTLYDRFGDRDALVDCFDSMKRWVDLLVERAGDDLLWETGQQFGDWLDPDAPPDLPGHAKTDADIVATAYFARSAAMTARTATILGDAAAAEKYRLLAERIRHAFQFTYVTPRGRMMSDAPTAYALAIVFDLVDDELKPVLGERLAELIRRAGYRISTGFVGTPIVCDALTATGREATAGRLLLQTECPSWLYPVTMGATSIWERWDSMLEDGSINPGQMTSFNHYALGAVADWLHRCLAGLSAADTAYRTLRISPTVIDGVDDAAAWHQTPYGRASSGWRRLHDDSVVVVAEVPANTTAEVTLPSGTRHHVGSGRHEWVERLPAASAVHKPLDLKSSLSDVIDNEAAYRTVVQAIAQIDPARAEAFRRTTQWRTGRALEEPLNKAPVPILRAVERALARVTA
ncbi:glycoside hydrolase family 78 protein [soil metagenome]